jgi:tRNA(Arg) A34 adenosine deaminase TadA
MSTCAVCGGTGYTESMCPTCLGSGRFCYGNDAYGQPYYGECQNCDGMRYVRTPCGCGGAIADIIRLSDSDHRTGHGKPYIWAEPLAGSDAASDNTSDDQLFEPLGPDVLAGTSSSDDQLFEPLGPAAPVGTNGGTYEHGDAGAESAGAEGVMDPRGAQQTLTDEEQQARELIERLWQPPDYDKVCEPKVEDLRIAENNAKFFAEPPMWKPGKTYAQILAEMGPGWDYQNKNLYDSLGPLPLAVALPVVSATGAAFFIGTGSAALIAGDYDIALKSFATALALTPSEAAVNWRAEQSAHRAAWALQDQLEEAVLTHQRMKGSITISVGVMSDENRKAITVISMNGGAQKSLADKVRVLARERGMDFIEGGEHAEVNIIRAAEARGYSKVRVTASNYHCPQCQAAAEAAGIDAVLFSPNKGFINRKTPPGYIP